MIITTTTVVRSSTFDILDHIFKLDGKADNRKRSISESPLWTRQGRQSGNEIRKNISKNRLKKTVLDSFFPGAIRNGLNDCEVVQLVASLRSTVYSTLYLTVLLQSRLTES
jgi:hypothetical protein